MRIGQAGVALALVLALGAGCSDDESAPSGGPSGESGGAASESPSGSSSAPDPEGSVAPATGTPVETERLRFRLPADVRWQTGRAGQSAHWTDRDGYPYDIAFGDFGAGVSDVEEAARAALPDARSWNADVRRTADREVAGVPGYVLEGEGDDGYYYEFGTSYEDHGMSVSFQFPRRDARAQEWIESVLASFEWR